MDTSPVRRRRGVVIDFDIRQAAYLRGFTLVQLSQLSGVDRTVIYDAMDGRRVEPRTRTRLIQSLNQHPIVTLASEEVGQGHVRSAEGHGGE